MVRGGGLCETTQIITADPIIGSGFMVDSDKADFSWSKIAEYFSVLDIFIGCYLRIKNELI
jgi:hypothetical protein